MGFSYMTNPFRSLSATMEIPDDIGVRLRRPGKPIGMNSSRNTRVKLVGRIQTNRTFVDEQSDDQRSHILECCAQEISPRVDGPG
jgi:hypothetical protein